MDVKINIYGVRGSAAISHKDYLQYGGNTASFTIRTPDNSLIFLDAGTGIKFAERELQQIADKVFLLISHTHADHIVGFGMSKLSKLNLQNGYEKTKLQIIGPKDVQRSMSKFYDGDVIWPVKFGQSSGNTWSMIGIDYQNIIEFTHNYQEVDVDANTKVILMQGNHPVKNGVILYKTEITTSEKIFKIIYATDNEFDFIVNGDINPKRKELKSNYIKFIENADLLIAEAQYSKDKYDTMKGFGHSFPEQIIELANEANVKRIILTHHDFVPDLELEKSSEKVIQFAAELNPKLILDFAIEGTELIL